jgi:predicted alpha/beta-hydrolase family hydrolase
MLRADSQAPQRQVEVETSFGRAQVLIEEPDGAPSFLLALTHGAGGGVDAPDLLAVRDAALRLGGVVARVIQPYRVRGARAPGSVPRQDAAWVEIITALRSLPLAGAGAPLPAGSDEAFPPGSGEPLPPGSGEPLPPGSGDQVPPGPAEPVPSGSGEPVLSGSGEPALSGSGEPVLSGSGDSLSRGRDGLLPRGAGGLLPLVQGGRSNGARVACRTAAAVDAVAVIVLAFPLRPPGRPDRSRAADLRIPGRKLLIVSGDRDPFGVPGRRAGARVAVLAGETHALSRRPAEVGRAVAAWLPRALGLPRAPRPARDPRPARNPRPARDPRPT